MSAFVYRQFGRSTLAIFLATLAGPIQLDEQATPAEHPSLAVSPLDGAVTVAWVWRETASTSAP